MGFYVMVLKSIDSILFKYYMISLKESLKPLHVVPWVLTYGDVWSYFWFHGYWDVYGGSSHIHSLICWRILWKSYSWWYVLWHPHVWDLWRPWNIEVFKGIRIRICKLTHHREIFLVNPFPLIHWEYSKFLWLKIYDFFKLVHSTFFHELTKQNRI